MEPAHALREPQLARPDSTREEPPGADRPMQRLARATGLLYLVLAVLGMFSAMVLESLAVPGDAQATADGILGARWLFGSSLVTWLAVVVADVAIAVTWRAGERGPAHPRRPRRARPDRLAAAARRQGAATGDPAGRLRSNGTFLSALDVAARPPRT
jgi:Domain of unknown function (DUF4386)